MLSSEVTIRAVVTAVFPELTGYYVQEASGGDSDPATSDGVFVFDRSADVQQGELLEMSATVTDYRGNLQATPRGVPRVCGTHPLPPPVVLNQLPTRAEAPAAWASLQGMLITTSATVSGVGSLQRYGEVQLSSGGRLITPSQIYDPLSPEHDELLASYRDTLILTSGATKQNPDPIPFPAGGLSSSNPLRVGDTMLNVTGALGYRYGKNLLDQLPLSPGLSSPVHLRSNPRPTEMPEVGGRLKISCFNVENYFVGPPLGLPFGDRKARGAQSEVEFGRQRAKTHSAMVALDAAVVALSELENTGDAPGSAVQDLVNGLNEVAGSTKYAAVPLPKKIGTDVISSNFIYQPALVKVVGVPAILDSSVDPLFLDTKNRPTLAVSFEELSSGNQLTVAANHLKSKGSSCESCCKDPEIPGAGNCNGVRESAARAVGRWLQTKPTGIATEDILITGDMNALHAESPIQALIQDFGYVDMVDQFWSKTKAYSYVFRGLSGYLDHALASPSLAAKIAEVMDWHINADESSAFGYDMGFKSSGQIEEYYAADPFRCSDHDPLLLGLY